MCMQYMIILLYISLTPFYTQKLTQSVGVTPEAVLECNRKDNAHS